MQPPAESLTRSGYLEARTSTCDSLCSLRSAWYPAAVILWFARDFTPLADADVSDDFSVTPLNPVTSSSSLASRQSSLPRTGLPSSFATRPRGPGLHSARSLSGALLMYRMRKLNNIQLLWTWTITGQYLRALAGMRFTCGWVRVRRHAQSRARTRHGGRAGVLVERLFYQYARLRRRAHQVASARPAAQVLCRQQLCCRIRPLAVELPARCIDPCSDINFRRQMQSRLGEPRLPGIPPSSLPARKWRTGQLSAFPLFLARVLLNDFFSIGMVPITDELIFMVLYVRSGAASVRSSARCSRCCSRASDLARVTVKKVLVGREWGADHSTPFWSWRHFAYFFAQDCFFVWCREPFGFSQERPREFHTPVDGMPDR